ncbi:glutathione peroxidase [uncultured Gammaproteobacteria bacterium]
MAMRVVGTAKTGLIAGMGMGLLTAFGLGGRSAPAGDATADHLDWRQVPLPGIDGQPLSSDQFLGRVVLVVNTASQCGFTRQYAELETVWRDYREVGLVVLAVPSNEFGGQEPGNDAEIRGFCETTFGIDFPMLAKQRVTGPGAHPLYRWAAGQTGLVGLPRWNFHKLLIGRDGRLIDWFSSLTEPSGDKMRDAIFHALAD